MTDDDLFALCIWDEAGNQPYEGMVAVGRVIRNRMALKVQSDGTVIGTVLHPFAFSGFMFDMVSGKYTQVVPSEPKDTLQARMMARAQTLLVDAEDESKVWELCVKAVADSDPDANFVGGPEFKKLTPETVTYVNLTISSPDWATPDKMVAKIYDHTFYRA